MGWIYPHWNGQICYIGVIWNRCKSKSRIIRLRLYLTPWTHGSSCSRPGCSSPGSLPWPWYQQRDSCIVGSGVSNGTSSHCFGRATRPLSCMPHSWGLPQQNAHAGILAGHLASLEKEEKVLDFYIIKDLNTVTSMLLLLLYGNM